jgi:hypothetical protein
METQEIRAIVNGTVISHFESKADRLSLIPHKYFRETLCVTRLFLDRQSIFVDLIPGLAHRV